MNSLFFILWMSLTAFSAELQLRSLSDASSVKLSDPAGASSRVVVIFQKKCSACRKQVKNLGCLKGNADLLLVGSFSTEQDLRKEYKSFGTDVTGVYGDKDFRKKFELDLEVTPQILIQTKNKIYRSVGFKSCGKILKFIEKARVSQLSTL